MITFKEFISESVNDKGIMKAIFVTGIPGAGKSYTIKQLSGSISPKVVNTDRATEYLSKKFDVESNSETWKSFFRDRTKPLTEAMLTNYVNSMLPLFVDGTSNNVSLVLNRAGILESLGYDVGMVFIDTDLEVAQARAKERGKATGRHVDSKFIEQVHQLASENREYFKGKFKFFHEIKNTPGELNDEALLKLFKSVSGFYTSKLENPVGKRAIESVREAKEQYLTPSVLSKEELSRKLEAWYR